MEKQRIIETCNNLLLHAVCILLAVVLSIFNSHGQARSTQLNGNTGERTVLPAENLALLTDRHTYIAGEEINFRIFNLSPESLKNPLWSRIVYVELLGLDNSPVIQQKFSLTGEGTSGMIRLPVSPASGYYYIRAYTRWMRNFPASDYASNLIRILNPGKDEAAMVQNRNGNGNTEYRFAGGFPDVHSGLPSLEVSVKNGKDVYGKRDKVALEVRVPDGIVENGLCLTVVRKEAMAPGLHFEYRDNKVAKGIEPGDWEYIPETRGMSISGRVILKEGGEPLANSRVQLSLIGKEPDFFGYRTTENGRFYIPLPDYHGTKDFYINAETGLSRRIEILIDQDFSTKYVIPRPVSLQIREEEKPVLEEMLVNAQVNGIYKHKDPEADSTAKGTANSLNFYGEPWFTVQIDDYVKLPTLEEFIFELVPEVIVRKKEGRKQILVTGNPNSDLAIYSPLVLLDHVAVTDLDAILEVSPERIESIDLIIGSYIRGDITYGGILSITSRNSDLAGIDLPDDSYFFNYTTLSIPSGMNFPDYSSGNGNMRNPDFRNCLYWEPDMEKDDDGIFRSVFYTSDRVGEYLVVVRGFDTSGLPVYGSTTLQVFSPAPHSRRR